MLTEEEFTRDWLGREVEFPLRGANTPQRGVVRAMSEEGHLICEVEHIMGWSAAPGRTGAQHGWRLVRFGMTAERLRDALFWQVSHKRARPIEQSARVPADLSAWPLPCAACGERNALYRSALSVQVREHGCRR